MATTVYISNDNYIELDSLKNAATDSYINDATVSVTVKTEGGANVTGETWPLTMSYVSASNGKYRATLQNALSLSADTNYVAHISGTGSTLDFYWEMALIARKRTA